MRGLEAGWKLVPIVALLAVACGDGRGAAPAAVRAEPCPPSSSASVPADCGGRVLEVVGGVEPVRTLTPPARVLAAPALAGQAILVEVIVARDGVAHLQRVLRGPCDESVEAAIRVALVGARYQPARLAGEPSCSFYVLTLVTSP